MNNKSSSPLRFRLIVCRNMRLWWIPKQQSHRIGNTGNNRLRKKFYRLFCALDYLLVWHRIRISFCKLNGMAAWWKENEIDGRKNPTGVSAGCHWGGRWRLGKVAARISKCSHQWWWSEWIWSRRARRWFRRLPTLTSPLFMSTAETTESPKNAAKEMCLSADYFLGLFWLLDGDAKLLFIIYSGICRA